MLRSLPFLLATALFAVEPGADVHYNEAVKALNSRDFQTALEELEVVLASEPDNIRYGSEYRQAAIQAGAYERCLNFFDKLVKVHPNAPNAWLNYGFAYVDKIPAAGSITQVILANAALREFTRALRLKPSWIAYYTRGNSYLFWPKVFHRAHLGVADLERAVRLQRNEPEHAYHARAWVSLGDGYWKMDRLQKAKAVWREGLEQFPDNPLLKERLEKDGTDLKGAIEAALDPYKRVDTNLQELWANQ
jgi:tetratricopeptide (TPR) repeat protein